MSWLSGQLQSSLGSLKNQVASSLKEVFEAVDEDDEQDLELDNPEVDPKERIGQAKWRIRELKDSLEKRTTDLDKVKQQNEILLQQRKSLEEQKTLQTDQLKELLLDKEAEIELLISEKDQIVQSQNLNQNHEELALLRNQIESLQNFLAEVKQKHTVEIEELTKSFLSRTQGSNNESDNSELVDRLNAENASLQKALEDERKKYWIEIEELKKGSLQQPNKKPCLQNGSLDANETDSEAETLQKNFPEYQNEIENLTKHVRGLQGEKDDLAAEVLNLKSRLLETENNVRETQIVFAEKENFKIEIDELSKQVNELQSERDGHEAEILNVKKVADEILAAEKEKNKKAIEAVQNNLEVQDGKYQSEVERLSSQLKSVQEESELNVHRIEATKSSEIEALKNNFSSESGALQQQIQECANQIDALRSERDVQVTEIERLKGVIQDIQKGETDQINFLKNQHEGETVFYKQEIERIQHQLQIVVAEKERLSSDVEEINAAAADTRNREVEALQKSSSEDREKSERQIESLKQQLAAIQKDNEEGATKNLEEAYKNEVQRIQSEVESRTKQLDEITARCAELNSTVQKLTAENAGLIKTRTELEKINQLNQELDQQNQVLNRSLANNSTAVESLKSENAKIATERDEARNDKILLENECSHLKEKLDNLIRDYGQLREQYQDIESNNQNTSREIIQEKENEIQRLQELIQTKNFDFEELRRQNEDANQKLQENKLEAQAIIDQLRDQVQTCQQTLEDELAQKSIEIEETIRTFENHRASDKETLQLELDSTLKSFDEERNRNNEQLRQAESEREKLLIEISALKSDKELKSLQIEELLNEIATFKSESNSSVEIQNRLHQLQSHFDQVKNNLQIAEERNAKLTSDLQSLTTVEDQLKLFSEQNRLILAEKASLESELCNQKFQNEQLVIDLGKLKGESEGRNSAENQYLKKTIEELSQQVKNFRSREQSWFAESERLMSKIAETNETLLKATKKIDLMEEQNRGLTVANEEKVHDLEMAKRNIQELTGMLEEKNADTLSDQQHKMQSLAAIQELQAQLSQSRRDRDKAQSRVADRDRELQELKREVNTVIEKKRKLEQEVERLKHHLVTVEETNTQEALTSEDREKELRKKLQVTEEALRIASAQQNSANKEATVHVQVLENKMVELSQERDRLRGQMRLVSDELSKKSRSLANLEMALAGLQEEKNNEVRLAEQSYKETLMRERLRQAQLENELVLLRQRVQQTDEVLAKANSLGEQITSKNQTISALRQEIKLKDEMLQKAQEEFGDKAVNNARFERNLVKNLIVSYFQADDKQKSEVLALIAKVLGFDEEERIKTGLDKPGYGLRYLRSMMPTRGASESEPLDLSIAEAFVKFLENESTPKTPIRLPASQMAEETVARRSRQSSVSSSTPGPDGTETTGPKNGSPNPLVMAGNSTPAQMPALPTFSVNRSSSAILRHVLQEE